jgi:hypothetical protein
MTHNPHANAYPVGGRPWTREDDELLLSKLREGVIQKAIAVLLDRTLPAVKWRAKVLRFGVPKQAARQWTAEETELALKLLRDNASDATIRSTIGRTKFACYDRLKRIGRPFSEPTAPQINVPDYVLEDRNRRWMAPRSLTAVIFGDPEPNRVRL